MLFAAIGALVLWRTRSENKKSDTAIVRRPNDSFFAHPVLLYTFGSLMVLSGVLCFLLRKNWFMHIDYKLKTPFFATLGMSFSFVIIFLLADCLNYCAITCPRTEGRPVVESNHQVYLLAGAAIVMGFLYGLIFGFMDLEDANLYRLSVLAMKEESYCYPIGIVLGCVAGVANAFIRERGGELPVSSTPSKFEQEI